jgi:predicted Rossmann fold flavoprotein
MSTGERLSMVNNNLGARKSTTPDRFDLIIIGGGAAGLFAAICAARRKLKIAVLERNKTLGRKLRITGKGRCNLTNNCTDEAFFANIPANSKFLYSAYNAFKAADTMKFFEDLGVPLKTERGNRVFPVSDNAHDIADAMVRECERLGVVIKEFFVKEILTQSGHSDGTNGSVGGGAFGGVGGGVNGGIGSGANNGEDSFRVTGVSDGKGNCLYAENILFTTGGKSYPGTGSDGNGYELARSLGLAVTDIRPSLIPLVSSDSFVKDLQGLSLKNVRLTMTESKTPETKGSGKVVFTEQGEMLFTDWGLSGPLVLSASAHIKNPSNAVCHIDLKPALDRDTLDKRIVRDFAENPNRIFANALDKLLPASLRPVVVSRSGIESTRQVNSITKSERLRLVELLKDFTVSIKAFRPIAEAVITRGGVSLKEVNPKTMACKSIPNLYFAGEILDLDGYTGGFNLQIAFSTAFAAASAIEFKIFEKE